MLRVTNQSAKQAAMKPPNSSRMTDVVMAGSGFHHLGKTRNET
jgi:hypothetical protein